MYDHSPRASHWLGGTPSPLGLDLGSDGQTSTSSLIARVISVTPIIVLIKSASNCFYYCYLCRCGWQTRWVIVYVLTIFTAILSAINRAEAESRLMTIVVNRMDSQDRALKGSSFNNIQEYEE